MDKKAEIMERDRLGPQASRLLEYLQEAAAQLRNGEDTDGIDSLLSAASELEKLVEDDQRAGQSQLDLGSLLVPLRSAYSYLHNRDIAGIADFLEDTVCPMAEQWAKGSGGE